MAGTEGNEVADRLLRELGEADSALALPVLLDLRPHVGSGQALAEAIGRQRADGYRLLAAFVTGQPDAVAVAGFRVMEMLAWGRILYVDDLGTLPDHRGAGHARALMDRLAELAADEHCDELHLDSGVGPHRAAAHTLYQVSGLHVSALHFSRTLRG